MLLALMPKAGTTKGDHGRLAHIFSEDARLPGGSGGFFQRALLCKACLPADLRTGLCM